MDINIPEVLAEVTAAFNAYEAALTGNDVAVLDGLFWDSSAVVRYGATENLYGHAQILAFRKARPSAGLARELRSTVITTFGRDFATANTEFRRDSSAGIGRQSHSWARLEGGWKIVAAHVSLMSD
ncbi:oxalurate catabolism protein HpxZ [Pseudoruegeria sp. SK021]|uniref:oxalurate catabolism protein HpxZ n=1 Tax=Pseudoruegeria sp. SK021 TaxID=1933035 RepID=UPI000A253C28|nr:oxalurate catabolism protein HpxZ [Pseudoruegeria sp. SK021]OSP53939.1 DUF4440 domain-containing protein [Pseudoruegeria sp. SK021]